jgi:putative effector of murein hydrolase LrgA (UPF0299 family)
MSDNTAIFIILIIISTSVPILAIGWIVKMIFNSKFDHKYGSLHKHERE